MWSTVIGLGSSFPGQKGISHQPIEWVDIDDLIKICQIYALVLYRLDMANKKLAVKISC